MTAAPTPVEIARQALRRLAQLGLPPTPENYETHYREIAGVPPREAGAGGTRAEQAQVLEMLRALLHLVTQANEGLHSDLGRFGDESRQLVMQLEAGGGAEATGELVQGLTASATWLLTQVEATRQELDLARQQINRVHEDLERAEALAITDPLTELPNRRGMSEAIRRELSRARRYKSDLCFAIIDIDHFKRINDRHGHAVGDEALVHLANVIRPGIRETDVLGRYGGEEFLLLLADTPLPGAEFTVSRLLRMLERSPLHTRDGPVTMTFSAGLAQWQVGESAEQAIERADQAMYAAKRAGRACVQVAVEAEPQPAAGAAPV